MSLALDLRKFEDERFSIAHRIFSADETDQSVCRVFVVLLDNLDREFRSSELIENRTDLSDLTGATIRNLLRRISLHLTRKDFGYYMIRERVPVNEYVYKLTSKKPELFDSPYPEDTRVVLSSMSGEARREILEAILNAEEGEYSNSEFLAYLGNPEGYSVQTAAQIVRDEQYSLDVAVDVRADSGVFVRHLPPNILQILNHDWRGVRHVSRRRIMRVLAHSPGKKFTAKEIFEATAIKSIIGVRNLISKGILPLFSIEEYVEAYGCTVREFLGTIIAPTRWEGVKQELEVSKFQLDILSKQVPERRRMRLERIPRSTAKKKFEEGEYESHMSSVRVMTSGIQVLEEVPDNAEQRIKRATFVFKEEEGEIDMCLEILQSLRSGEKAAAWPFKLKADQPQPRFMHDKSALSERFAAELGFVIHCLGGGYCTLYFLDDDERGLYLDDKYDDVHVVNQYLCKTKEVTKRRVEMISSKCREYVKKNGAFPCWMPSEAHLLFIQAVARNQRKANKGKGNYLDIHGARAAIARATGLRSRSMLDGRVNQIVNDLYENHDLSGCFVRRRFGRYPSFEIVLVDFEEGDVCY